MEVVFSMWRKWSAGGFAPVLMAHTGLRLPRFGLRQHMEPVAGALDPSEEVEDTLSIGERTLTFSGSCLCDEVFLL